MTSGRWWNRRFQPSFSQKLQFYSDPHSINVLLQSSGICLRDFTTQVAHRNEKRYIQKERINSFSLPASPLPQTHLADHWERFSPLGSSVMGKSKISVWLFCESRVQSCFGQPGFRQFPGLLQPSFTYHPGGLHPQTQACSFPSGSQWTLGPRYTPQTQVPGLPTQTGPQTAFEPIPTDQVPGHLL